MTITAKKEHGIYWMEGVEPKFFTSLRELGWTYDEDHNRWGTRHTDIAEVLFPKDSISIARGKVLEALNITSSGSLDYQATCFRHPYCEPGSDLKLRDYQMAGLQQLIRPGNHLLADDMGLGKTIQAICAINVLNAGRVLIVCPASVKENWRIELEKWLVQQLTIGIAYGDDLPDTDIVIINYDIFGRHLKTLQALGWDMFIIDEAQYLQNYETQRTRSVLGTVKTPTIEADKIIALTGTPITNRPIELYSLLKRLDYFGWGDRRSFVQTFCDGHWENRPVRGGGTVKTWIDTGSTQPEKLQKRLRSTIMTRRLKKQALPELPPKTRQIIYLEPDKRAATALKTEELIFGSTNIRRDILSDEEYNKISKTLMGIQPAFSETSAVRRETGLAKIPLALDHIHQVLEQTDKVILFAHHIEVIQALRQEFYNSVVLDGRTTDRQEIVDVFTSDPQIKLFIGNIKAAGVGINLTIASTILFIEHPWTPAATNQAEDRAYRYGQLNPVLVQHLVLKESLDATMIRTTIRKQEIIDKVVN